MKAKILIDNVTKDELIAEWGLSIAIEYEGHQILLDTGATGQFVRNAKEMGVSLSDIEFGVLSHAHYDHSDGLGAFFERNEKAPFYLRKGTEENCYGKMWIFSHYIGIHKGYLKTYHDRFIFADGDYEIMPGVTLIPHKTPSLDMIGKSAHMYTKVKHHWKADDFSHEQSLVLDTDKGLVIFNSCSHGGADNIIREVHTTYPDKKIYALIGGFHLHATPDADVRALAARIQETGIQHIYTGHCTGKRALDILTEELGSDIVTGMYTGLTIDI